MKINKAYKVELKPNNKQMTLLEKSAGTARFAYNWGLNERIELYKSEKKSLTAIDQHKILCAKKKTDYSWMYEVSKMAPQEALRDLDKAFKNFFRGIKKGQKIGFPKFKSKHKSKQKFSISYGFYVSNTEVKIPKVGRVRLKEKGYIPTKDVKINSMTVSKEADRWFVSVQVGQDIQEPKELETVLGVDVGIKELAVCSNGQIFENYKHLKKSKKKLAHSQKTLARKKFNKETKKSSNNRNKDKLKVQKIFRRIKSQRLDTIHKMTSNLVKTKPRYIVLEDLNVKGMMKNHKLAGAVADASFYEIKRQLQYKTSWYGGEVIDVNRFFPSSKLCSSCGCLKEDLTLQDRRTYTCDCGLSIDRDLNASINLEHYGLDKLKHTVSSTGIKACGESVRPKEDVSLLEAVSTKQEENMEFSSC